uniref:Uncharacterized protein n=1 Tax=Arion vulgaris TaxID=1028688 RepID=A0A0B6ZJA6_9EUPU
MANALFREVGAAVGVGSDVARVVEASETQDGVVDDADDHPSNMTTRMKPETLVMTQNGCSRNEALANCCSLAYLESHLLLHRCYV